MLPLSQDRMDFLRRDLVHLFDEQGIDKNSYEEVVEFVDPITSYRRLSGVRDGGSIRPDSAQVGTADASHQ